MNVKWNKKSERISEPSAQREAYAYAILILIEDILKVDINGHTFGT